MVPKYPKVEARPIEKKTKKGIVTITRYFVVGVPTFYADNGYGFKSEDSLMRCYNWWWNNVFKTGRSAKEASREWKNNERDQFYENKRKNTECSVK